MCAYTASWRFEAVSAGGVWADTRGLNGEQANGEGGAQPDAVSLHEVTVCPSNSEHDVGFGLSILSVQ